MSERIISVEGRKPKVAQKIPLAKRPDTLKGKKVALYYNEKVAAFPSLRVVGKLLREKLGVTDIIEVHSQRPFSSHPQSVIDAALKADAVFLSAGD